MSSFGYYAFGTSYSSNSQMLDCTRTPHMHYYSDEMFHFKTWLHMPSALRASKATTGAMVANDGEHTAKSKTPRRQVSLLA